MSSFQRVTGDIQPLRWLREGSNKKVLTLVCDGFMATAEAAADLIPLQKYIQHSSTIVGTSSGACTVPHIFSQTVEEGSQVYWDECCDGNFVSYRGAFRLLPGFKWIAGNQFFLNKNYLVQALNGELRSKGIEWNAIPAGRLFFSVTDGRDGSLVFIDPIQSANEASEVMKASFTVPLLTDAPTHLDVDGNHVAYFDGGMNGLHIKECYDYFKPDGMIVFLNRTKEWFEDDKIQRPLERNGFLPLAKKLMPAHLYELLLQRHDRGKEDIRWAQKNDIPITLVWSPGRILSVEQNTQKIKDMIKTNSEEMWAFLETM